MELAAAITEGDWTTALRAALETWRATRDPLVARLIDRISSRLALVQPPVGGALHAWWMRHACPYDPIIATTLLGHAVVRSRGRDVAWSDVAERWPDAAIVAAIEEDERSNATNWIERMAAIETWPDDPRLTRLLASWLFGPIRHVHDTQRPDVAKVLAERLVQLADVRILPRLEVYRVHAVNDLERAFIAALVERLAQVQPQDAGVEPLLAILDAPTPIEQLWQRAARDREARSVLADALVEVGESRGTYIALSLATDESRWRRAARLLSKEWERWLGPDLALLAVHDGTEFHGGMLEVLCVGQPSTPRWVWSAVAGHHELRSVHTVRPDTIRDHRDYAQFLTDLEQLRTLERVAPPTLTALAAIGARLRVTRMTLRRFLAVDELPDPFPLVELARSIAPELQELHLPRVLVTDELVAAYPDLVRVSS